MSLLIKSLVSFLVICFSSPSYSCFIGTQDKSSFYERVLFPDGLPRDRAYFDNIDRSQRFILYADSDFSIGGDHLTGVVYSLETPERLPTDSFHKVFISLFKSQSNGHCDLVFQEDITSKVTTFIEAPGVFWALDAAIETLHVKIGRVLHISLSSVLSGTGGIRSTSDVLYLVQDPGMKIHEFLYLTNIYTHGITLNKNDSVCLVPWLRDDPNVIKVFLVNAKNEVVKRFDLSGQSLSKMSEVLIDNANKTVGLQNTDIKLKSLLYNCMNP